MKRYFKILILSLCFVGSLYFSACGKKRDYPKAPEYINPAGDEMPVIGSYGFWQPELITPEKYHEMREAGFNIARQSMHVDKLDKALVAIDGTGMKLVMYCWEALNPDRTVEVISKYKNNPDICGYFVVDEPTVEKFPHVKSLYNLILEADSTKFISHNLLPKVGKKQLGGVNYKDYIDKFIREINPAYISFDIYPVRQHGDGRIYLSDVHYATLEAISSAAKESGRPFLAYVNSVKHFIYPKPREAFIRYQVFAALAYGAQGIQYYTYAIPDFDKGKEYSDAPIDMEGNRTDVWYMVRNVNNEIHALEKVFLGCDVIDVRHTGVSLPDGTKRLRKAPAPFKDIRSEGDGIVVSHLRNGDSEFLVMLNRDVLNHQKVRFGLRRPVTRVWPDGRETETSGESAILSPGGYAIYRLDEVKPCD